MALRPICAQLPTSACESIIVPSPTYAPAFTNIGGMHTTSRPMWQPSRILDPPGTIRTLSLTAKCRTG